jgi:cullin 4
VERFPVGSYACRAQKAFEEHYLSKTSGRRLVWYSILETCTLKARYSNGDKDLQVSMHQAAVLMLFNERDEHTFRDIRDALKLPDDELRRTLQSLALGKVSTPRVLEQNVSAVYFCQVLIIHIP